ncbi:MAG: peptide chain release factor N(5)-glutamine methyltransferase [Bacilli bacterium]|nr:peptide chain release factor N(5)-glutamine methyltransferase [Bacilli bacterium]
MQAKEYLKKYLEPSKLEEGLKRLENGEAVQYIVGNVEFYNTVINVNKNVLIPRFETEELVEKTINYINKYFNKKIDILDLGTGSGCIAIALAKNTDSCVDAVDISDKALEVARENALLNNVDVNFIKQDMTIPNDKLYDVIISNPPYLRDESEVEEIVKNNEPELALYANDDGMYFYKKILENYKNSLKDRFIIAFELGYNQADILCEFAKKIYSNSKVIIDYDLTGYKRFLFVINVD